MMHIICEYTGKVKLIPISKWLFVNHIIFFGALLEPLPPSIILHHLLALYILQTNQIFNQLVDLKFQPNQISTKSNIKSSLFSPGSC